MPTTTSPLYSRPFPSSPTASRTSSSTEPHPRSPFAMSFSTSTSTKKRVEEDEEDLDPSIRHKCMAEPTKLGSVESTVLKRVQEEFGTAK
ncbi:hypothetical protein glysoja_040850 [Glycine soja]|uniref:Uncharacterized protein n=1 Tax=Glycine soja TaxID=3848 RepID=A0A0B2R9L2_GLYSO|nr:hypothetical protein glysoja_040850 [Glycine soja]